MIKIFLSLLFITDLLLIKYINNKNDKVFNRIIFRIIIGLCVITFITVILLVFNYLDERIMQTHDIDSTNESESIVLVDDTFLVILTGVKVSLGIISVYLIFSSIINIIYSRYCLKKRKEKTEKDDEHDEMEDIKKCDVNNMLYKADLLLGINCFILLIIACSIYTT